MTLPSTILSNAIRALAIIFPVLIPASYLLKNIPLVLTAQLITWLIYAIALSYWPIRRRGLYTFIVMLLVTFCYAIIGAIAHTHFATDHQLAEKIGAVIVGALVLTVGTVLFTLIAWLVLLLLDRPFYRVASRFIKHN